MAQKSGLNFKKILGYIGLYMDRDDAEAERQTTRYQEDAYEEPRYTPPRKNDRGGYGYQQQEERFYEERFDRRPQQAEPRPRQNQARNPRPAPQPRARNQAEEREMVRHEGTMQAHTSTMVYYLHSLSECGDVIQDLIRGNSVFMNLEETDSAQMQRIVDTLAGATFALNAKIRKVSEKTYLIAPKNVNVNMTRNVERRY